MADRSDGPSGHELGHGHRQRQQEYEDYLDLTKQVQAELQDLVDELQSQEGWDQEIRLGVAEWVEDLDTIWRVLRRSRYDPDKAHDNLLSILTARVSRKLHLPIPSFPPYSDSPLFYILPLPQFVDRSDRPIVVLTLREVTRDENGKMGDLKEWTWWALEMVRRTLRDWWVEDVWPDEGRRCGKRRGSGGEGCVLLVDAAGAGYRNLEVELLPTLLSVGHNNFPGIFEAVYVVNAGWTHRSMWKVVRRVLPKSALEKVNFLDTKQELKEVFDLDKLPKIYGGNQDYVFEATGSPILSRYTRHPSYHNLTPSPSGPISRAVSSSTIADIYYTAVNNTTNNTPIQSRSASRRHSMANALGLRMTRSHGDGSRPTHSSLDDAPPVEAPRTQETIRNRQAGWKRQIELAPKQTLSRSSSHTSLIHATPLQRIKSLSDFHLYLSPSRLAHIDLLSDSDNESPPPPPPPRRVLRPAIFENGGLAARRKRPVLQVAGQVDSARSYSDRLQDHHAKALELYREAMKGEHHVPILIPPTPPSDPEPEEVISDPPDEAAPEPQSTPIQRISRFSSDSNPWYGYPAIRVPDSARPGHSRIQPRYDRNRKRDLVKTLLFLFILRIQAWRDAFERWLGLNRLGTWGGLSVEPSEAKNPSEGLMRTALSSGSERGRKMIKTTLVNERIWMGVMFLLIRGTWTGILAAPLEAMGLASVRDMLGLV